MRARDAFLEEPDLLQDRGEPDVRVDRDGIDLDDQRVAGLRPDHFDRPGQRVAATGIELGERRHERGLVRVRIEGEGVCGLHRDGLSHGQSGHRADRGIKAAPKRLARAGDDLMGRAHERALTA